MNYKEFNQLVINNMPENPIPGLWQQKGQLRTHILGNPSTSEQKAELINKYSLLPNVPSIDCNTIHLHQYAHHLNSSQIMCYNFFRPLIESYDGKMYKPKDSLLNLIGMEIDQEIEPHGAVCNFEYIDDSAENTNFDFYFKKEDVEVFFEIKYTEREFSQKSSAKDPHAQYESIYKPMIENTKELFIGETLSEQDFNNEYYQLARNSIRATSADKHVFFVCPKEHEELINQFVEFSDKYLTEKGKERIKLITWEDLVQDAYRLGINVNEFANRYLAFMP
jgi:hypothetical protein